MFKGLSVAFLLVTLYTLSASEVQTSQPDAEPAGSATVTRCSPIQEDNHPIAQTAVDQGKGVDLENRLATARTASDVSAKRGRAAVDSAKATAQRIRRYTGTESLASSDVLSGFAPTETDQPYDIAKAWQFYKDLILRPNAKAGALYGDTALVQLTAGAAVAAAKDAHVSTDVYRPEAEASVARAQEAEVVEELSELREAEAWARDAYKKHKAASLPSKREGSSGLQEAPTSKKPRLEASVKLRSVAL